MSRRRGILVLVALTLVIASLACTRPVANVLTPTPSSVSPPESSPSLEPANVLEDQVVAVYEQAAPAVVNITTEILTYDFFMRPVPQEGGTGSGFLYDEEGHIVTNYHVVENAESVSVAMVNGEIYEAEIVGTDSSTDLAVLHIDAERLPDPIPLGDSDQLRVGQFVLAIGSPFRQEGTLTVGVISALGRVIESPDGRFIGEAIQTDASVNPGNSGGPLLDLYGRVIGVNSQIISPSGASAGIGFAVSSNTVRQVVPELIARGRYPHPWIGIGFIPFDTQGAQILRENGMEIPVDEGLLITEIASGSPAEQAGIQGPDRIVRLGRYNIPLGGDILIAVDDEPVVSLRELNVYLETETQVGDTVTLTLIRDGEEIQVPVTLAERPE